MLVALSILTLSLSLVAQEEPVTPEARFDLRLEELRELAREGEWQTAHDGLVELFEEHANEHYALLHVFELQEALPKLAFRAQHKAPTYKDATDGKVLAYSASNGKLRIRYTADDLWPTPKELPPDFLRWGRYARHSSYLQGNFTVKIEGQAYCGRLGKSTGAPLCRIGIGTAQTGWIRFGEAREKSHILHHTGGPYSESIASREQDVLRRGEPYSIEVRARGKKLDVICNGKKYLSAKYPETIEGSFAISNLGGMTSIEISGRVTSSWMQGLIDEKVQSAWSRWKEDNDTGEKIPQWVREFLDSARDELELFPPPGATKDTAAHWKEFRTHVRERDFDSAQDLAKDLPSGSTDSYKAFFEAQLALWRGKTELAAKELAKIESQLVANPRKIILDARIASYEGDRDAALQKLERALVEGELPAQGYVDLCRLLLLQGRIQAADEYLERAVLAGAPFEELQEIGRVLVRSRRGPNWEKIFEYQGKNYRVQSNISKSVCKRAVEVLERSLQLYNAEVFDTGKSKKRRKYEVFLFAGQEGYSNFAEGLVGGRMENSLGYYTPLLKQLFIWDSPLPDKMIGTIRHEGFHQYLDTILPSAPTWMNEGMAEYFETSTDFGLRRAGAVHESNVRILANADKKHWTPLDELLTMPHTLFMQKAGMHYPQSWAVVHYFLQTTKDNRARFDKYFEALREGATFAQAAPRLYGEGDPEALLAKVRQHVRKLERKLD